MGASAEPRSESSEIADRLDRIEIAIRDLNRVSETCSGKDTWDKADVIGKFVSGVVLGLLGLYITLTIAHGQKETQIRITHDQQHFSTDQQELQQQFAKGQQSLQEAFVNQQAS